MNEDKKPSNVQMMDSVYVVPFRMVVTPLVVGANLPETFALTREQFISTIKLLLRGVNVDERWYRQQYPDVDQAIHDGKYKSAKHHFVEDGYLEGRRPGRALVDEKWYLAAYSDVAEGIEYGEITSCQDHFDAHGESEGRLPREY